MEFAVARALKPSLRREFIFQQAICEEILCMNANPVAGGEDFSVDDLLDFSNGEFQHGSLHYEQQEQEEYDEEKDSSSISSQSQDDSNSNSTGVSYDSIFSGELAVPADDLADLEWVSHFVDDSNSLPELSLLYPVRSEQTKTWDEPELRPCSAKKTPRFFPFDVKIPTKARTTKSRKPNARVWSFCPLLSRPSSPSSCSSSVLSSTAPPVVFRETPAKKRKKRAEGEPAGAQLQRRCSHCQVQKTPQWRTGPLGAKTLCNACGVRYKSGRLFQSIDRPAAPPSQTIFTPTATVKCWK